MEALYVLAFAIGLHELGRRSLVDPSPGRRRPAAGAGRRFRLRRSRSEASTRTACPGCCGSPGRPRPVGGGRAVIVARASSAGRGVDLARAPRPRPRGGCRGAVSPRRPPRSGGWSTSRASRPSIRRGPGSATSSIRSPRSRRSGSGRRATSVSTRAMAPCPPSASTSASCSGCLALAYGLVWWLRRPERAVPSALAVAARPVRLRALRGHPVPGGEVDRDRGAARDADRGPRADLAGAAIPLSCGRFVARSAGAERGRRASLPAGSRACGRSLATPSASPAPEPARARARQRACRPVDLHAGSSPSCEGPRRRFHRSSCSPSNVLNDEHGRDYVVWELRGGPRLRRLAASSARPRRRPAGVAHVVTQGEAARPTQGSRWSSTARPYTSGAATRRRPARPVPADLGRRARQPSRGLRAFRAGSCHRSRDLEARTAAAR